ncbi:MAG TPA: methyltransferase domain-containing protein [Ktedonobacterales bacterium]|jgi:predicted nicotinamide N-methyase
MNPGANDADAALSSTLQRLRRRLQSRYPLHELPVPLAGLAEPALITLPADPDGPLDQMAAIQAGKQRHDVTGAGAVRDAQRAVLSGAHMPYWALLWPSGMALAEALLAEPEIAGQGRTLELGCGLGVTAMAALHVGAALWTADCFTEALAFCRYNTLHNTGQRPHPLLLDWRSAAGREACVAAGPFALVLAADVFYEPEDVAPLLELIPRLLAPRGAFWLAEPGRRVSLAFTQAATERGWRDDPSNCERIWPHDTKPTRVTVHRYTLLHE